MYLEYYGLTEAPFRLTPDADFLFMSRAHARAKAYMDYTVLSRDGFVVVTGEIGAGKTTLINKLVAELPADVLVAKIFQTQLNEIEFLQAVLTEFGIEKFGTGKVELLNQINDFLIEMYRQNRRVLLIIDEAQNLSDKVLEEVRLLSGLETEKEKLVSIILAGQPELAQVVDSPRFEQLAQRVRLRFHLGALSLEETKEYIRHRLSVAGITDRELFTEDAFPVIFEYTGGIPRLVNSMCDMALLTAYVDERQVVDEDVIRASVDELGWVAFQDRPTQRARRVASTNQAVLPTPPAVAAAGTAVAAVQFSDALTEKVDRMYEFMPKMSAGLMGKMRLIEERLRDLADGLRRRD
ncbi:MAG TPA: AAA family ATPase [Gammaproteobacteria bacterium]|nr:AAA family ATPase [Gammaproteobacteria bacterium]